MLAALALVGYSGDAAARVRPTPFAPVASTMYVTISGPTETATGWTCSWEAYVSGGTAPYTFHWATTGMVETESYDNRWRGYAAVGGSVGLDVLVTDAIGTSRWGHPVIQSSNNAPFCTD